jgi:hypothetical protein
MVTLIIIVEHEAKRVAVRSRVSSVDAMQKNFAGRVSGVWTENGVEYAEVWWTNGQYATKEVGGLEKHPSR